MNNTLTWMGLTERQLEEGLIERKCTSVNLIKKEPTRKVSKNLIRTIENLGEPLHAPFREWWETGKVPEFGPQHGYMLKELIIEHPIVCNVPGGFGTMDQLMKEPDKTIQHIKAFAYDILT